MRLPFRKATPGRTAAVAGSHAAGGLRYLFLGSFAFVFAVWCCSLALALYGAPRIIAWLPSLPTNWSERGQLGDTFGAVNALFSGLALAGITLSFWTEAQERRSQAIAALRQDAETRRHRAISLLADWNSAAMLTSRIRANALTHRYETVLALSRYERMMVEPLADALAGATEALAREQEVNCQCLFHVVFFWERLALAHEVNDFDTEQARRYFRLASREYRTLFEKLLAEESKEGGSRWIETLTRISAFAKRIE